MKKLYCIANEDKNSKDIYVTDGGRPYAFFRYPLQGLNAGDVVFGIVENRSPKDGSFFANIGEKKNAFSDDSVAVKGLFPLQILALPHEEKGFFVSPVITFTGLFSVVRFIPDSISRRFSILGVSKKISGERAALLRSEICPLAEGLSGSVAGYNLSVTLRSICEDLDSPEPVKEEITVFFERFKNGTCSGASNAKRKPGDLVVKLSEPEFLTFRCGKYDFEQIVLSSPLDAEVFSGFYGRLPFNVPVAVRKHFDELNRFASYSGRNVYTSSGARVTYDRTEAMHVFDVNSAGSKLSHTAVNLEACDVIASIIGVRDLTGIIMCDFINMGSAADEELVVNRMKELRDLDYRPLHVYGFTELKVLECSRSK